MGGVGCRAANRPAGTPVAKVHPSGIVRGSAALLLALSGFLNSVCADNPVLDSETQDPALIGRTASAESLEPEVVLRSAAAILPARLLAGPNYELRDEVMVRGFLHYYFIVSDYGDFLAAGDEEVVQRIREIAAIAELRRLSKSEAVLDSATNAAKRSYVAAKEVIDEPWETAKALPSGLSRLFKRSKRRAEDAYDTVRNWYQDGNDDIPGREAHDAGMEDNGRTMEKIREAADLGIEEGQKYLKNTLGFNREFRRLSQRLGVDPYSRNTVLRNELASMAWTATAGSFAANVILPDTPAPIGILEDTRGLVWNMKPVDLFLRNEETLKERGFEADDLEAFFNNRQFTLSEQTRFVRAVERLPGVGGIGELLYKAARAQSREETRFYVRSAELLALYHERRVFISKLLDEEYSPIVALDGEDRLIVALPLDYLNWSETARDIALSMHDSLRRQAPPKMREVWVEGTVSPRASTELYRLGWRVEERALEKLSASRPRAG